MLNLGELLCYTYKKIQIIQNKVLRIIINALWFIHNENIIKTSNQQNCRPHTNLNKKFP